VGSKLKKLCESVKIKIMKLMGRKSKVKEISNKLGIPEATSYKYLEVLLTQSTKFGDHFKNVNGWSVVSRPN
jgi:predicted transcriptional regulator